MDDVGRVDDPAALEAFRQRLDLVATGNAGLFELFRRSLEIVGEELEPDLGLRLSIGALSIQSRFGPSLKPISGAFSS